jgi:hypothetical protein
MVLARPTEYLEAMIEACETYLEDWREAVVHTCQQYIYDVPNAICKLAILARIVPRQK